MSSVFWFFLSLKFWTRLKMTKDRVTTPQPLVYLYRSKLYHFCFNCTFAIKHMKLLRLLPLLIPRLPMYCFNIWSGQKVFYSYHYLLTVLVEIQPRDFHCNCYSNSPTLDNGRSLCLIMNKIIIIIKIGESLASIFKLGRPALTIGRGKWYQNKL